MCSCVNNHPGEACRSMMCNEKGCHWGEEHESEQMGPLEKMVKEVERNEREAPRFDLMIYLDRITEMEAQAISKMVRFLHGSPAGMSISYYEPTKVEED